MKMRIDIDEYAKRLTSPSCECIAEIRTSASGNYVSTRPLVFPAEKDKCYSEYTYIGDHKTWFCPCDRTLVENYVKRRNQSK